MAQDRADQTAHMCADKQVNKGTRFKRLAAFFVFLCGLSLIALYFFLAPCNQMELVNATACCPVKAPEGAPVAISLLGTKGQLCWFNAEKTDQKKIRLCGVLFVNPKATDVILISHGKGGSLGFVPYDYRMQSFFLQGHSLFLYDYAGYGYSQGKATYGGLLEDGLAAYDYLTKELNYAPSQVVLYGISLGGGVTGEIAGQRPCKAVILDSSFASTEHYVKQMASFMKIYPAFLYPRPYYNNMAFVQAPHAPLLIVHGGNDKMINKDNALLLRQLAKQPTTLVLLPNSGHAGMAAQDRTLFFDALKQFFATLKTTTTISKT